MNPITPDFWMVYGDGQGSPRVMHDSFESAQREARRLAAHHHGIRFYVLHAVGFAKHTDPVEYVRLDDGRPF
jgi:hypothetical protein